MDDFDDLIDDDGPPDEDVMLPPDGWVEEAPRTNTHQLQKHAETPKAQSFASADARAGVQGASQAASQASTLPPRLSNPPAFNQPQFNTPSAYQVIAFHLDLDCTDNKVRIA